LACAGSYQKAHALAFAATSLLLIPTLWRNCPLFGDIVTTFDTDHREVWLTIDDGPNPIETPAILSVLKKHNARATFFAIGKNVVRWPELAKSIVDQGHDIQNHTFSHQSSRFWMATPHVAQNEISLANEAIAAVTGIKPTLFRAPAGLANPFVHSMVEKAGLQMVGWSASGNDGIPHDSDNVIQKIYNVLSPGKIILLHESSLRHQPSGKRARTLENLLLKFEADGYKTALPFLEK
jgi:hypothetical protein